MTCNIRLNIENKGLVNFNYSFNKDTIFEDLLGYVWLLFPHYKICHCFSFFSFNNQEKIYIKNEDKISSYSPEIVQNLSIFKNKECSCDQLLNSFTKMNGLDKNIENLRKEIEKKDLTINTLEEKINGLKNEITKLRYIKIYDINSNYLYELDNTNFYDIIIDIKSIEDITNGWEIKYNKRNIEYFQFDKIMKIGFIGNFNKGKTFILNELLKSGTIFSETKVRTEGLCIKYDYGFNRKRKIAFLESAVLDNVILEDNNSIQEISNDKIITDYFLQNYIIHNSDILIIVVGILTYSEQAFLNKIKREIQKSNYNKDLYIIHNLINFTTVKQVEYYINTILINSEAFTLKLYIKSNSLSPRNSGVCYYENNNNNKQKIFHLIFAKDGSEAGNYYNGFTLKFIEDSYNSIELKPFNLIKTIKERFREISHKIIEISDKTIEFDNMNKKLIKLNNPDKIILKKCIIDERGFLNFKENDGDPNLPYNYYLKENKMIVRVEAPGNCEIETHIEFHEKYNTIKIKGNKKKDKEPAKIEDNIFNTREFGDFSIDIPFKSEEFLFKNEEPEIKQKIGVFILAYALEQKK